MRVHDNLVLLMLVANAVLLVGGAIVILLEAALADVVQSNYILVLQQGQEARLHGQIGYAALEHPRRRRLGGRQVFHGILGRGNGSGGIVGRLTRMGLLAPRGGIFRGGAPDLAEPPLADDRAEVQVALLDRLDAVVLVEEGEEERVLHQLLEGALGELELLCHVRRLLARGRAFARRLR